MQEVYVFSGLGADERVFVNIKFGNHTITHINWITPPKEITLQEYAQLLSKKITSSNSILVGLSFGGIMAIEVSKIIQPSKLILISSVKTKYELPLWMRVSGFLRLYNLLHLIPNKILNKPNAVVYAAFGIKMEKEKKLLQQIMADIDPIFLRWAIKQVACWQNIKLAENVFHIHGERDGIFPIRKIKNVLPIENAGHFMIRNKQAAMNRALASLL